MALIFQNCLSQIDTNLFVENCCCDLLCQLTNDSGSPIDIVLFTFSNPTSSYVISNVEIDGVPISLPFTIAANSSVDLGFQICVDNNANPETLHLEIKDVNGNVYTFDFPLNGITLNDIVSTSVDCGNINVGYSTTGSLTILDSLACCYQYTFYGLTAPFSIQSSQTVCNGDGNVDVPITFAPTTTGPFSQQLFLSIGECATIEIPVTGFGLEGSGLFVSYVDPGNPANIFCDNTVFGACSDPISRLYCDNIQIYCPGNTFCGTLAVNNGLTLCDCGDSWNCNLCGNDSPFWMPFVDGDHFMFQFQQPIDAGAPWDWYDGNNSNTIASFTILPCCESETPIDWLDYFETIVIQSFVGEFEVTTHDQQQIQIPIQQIEFDMNAIAEILIANGIEPCFSIQFEFATSGTFPDPSEKQTYCTEPFKRISCNEPSILIESDFTKNDCFAFYYGENWTQGAGQFPYKNRIRIPGSFEQTNFQVSKNVIESSGKAVSSQLCETWTFNSFALPPRMAKVLANILTGANIKINNQSFTFTGEIPKNNDISTRWFVSANFENCDCNHQLTSCE